MATTRYEGRPVPVSVGRRDVVQLPPRSFRVRLKGLLFETSRAFLLPQALNGIRRLRGYYDQHPGAEVLVVGHADTAGSDAYNLTLSRERAEAMAAFLRDDVEAWLPWYHAGDAAKRWDAREDTHMLSALGDEAGAFFSGPSEARADEGALRRFQEWSNAHQGTDLAVDGKAGDHTRRALIRAYMAQDRTSLPPDTTLEVHGCGEFHPEVQTGDGVAEAENRRVEVFLFEAGIAPPPRSPCPAPGCAEYAEWVGAVRDTVDVRDQEPVEAGRIFTLELPDDVLLPDDAELVVHGLDRSLRLRASEHHRADEGLYAFPIHDPPAGARCRGTLVATKATKVVFDDVDLSRYIEDAVAEGAAPPLLVLDLPGPEFQSRPAQDPREADPPEAAFTQPFEDVERVERLGERDFPPRHDHSGAFDDPGRAN